MALPAGGLDAVEDLVDRVLDRVPGLIRSASVFQAAVARRTPVAFCEASLCTVDVRGGHRNIRLVGDVDRAIGCRAAV